MPRVIHAHTNVTAGELSPRLMGRTDIARYANSAEVLENAVPTVQGGALGRNGSAYVSGTKTNANLSIAVPFVFSRDVAYTLEFGNQYMRVYTNAGQVQVSGLPYEITTPYTSAMLAELDWTQGSDTMFLFHPSVPTQRLQRFADDRWVMTDAPWIAAPYSEIGTRLNATLTVTPNVTGSQPVTASSSVFQASCVGRSLVGPGGAIGSITGFTSGTSITVNVTSPFQAASIAPNTWWLSGSPQCTVTPSAVGTVNSTITLTFGADAVASAPDTGAWVVLNGGLVQITSVTTATSATARVERVLTSTAAAAAGSWSIQYPVWNQFDGYPRTGTLYEQRLVAGGSARFPQTVWGSVSGQVLSFVRSTDDDGAFAFPVASNEANPIQYLRATETLVALTLGGELTIQGGIEKPLTPTNVQVRPRSNYGCAPVRPVRVGNELVYVQRGGRKVRAFSYNATNSEWRSRDLTLLAEHVTAGGVAGLAWAQERERTLWAYRADGLLLSCTLDPAEDVVAWARHPADGAVESIAVIPNGEVDTPWLIVRRTVNGATVRYVERLQEGRFPDCSIEGTAASPGVATWGNLAHLEGREVYTIADGAIMPAQTVTGGQITLPRPAMSVQIGLSFARKYQPVTPEVMTGSGTAQATAMSTNRVAVRFLETTNASVNGSDLSFRDFGVTPMGGPPVIFTGLKFIENLGWENGRSPVEVEQSPPYRFHVLGMVREFTTNSGGSM